MRVNHAGQHGGRQRPPWHPNSLRPLNVCTPHMEEGNKSTGLHWFLLLSGGAVLVWSGIRPKDYLAWLLEALPAVVGGVVLVATYRRFRLTGLTYVLIWIHAILLMVGGHWTYAQNPLFEWIRHALHHSRNYYDRLGHLAQGFVPAIIARELLLRTSPLKRGKWLSFLVVCTCLAVSAFYELIEWWVAAGVGDAAVTFLATQGDVWDTQWDMFLCLVGAVAALVTLGRLHDRQLAALPAKGPPPEAT